MTAFFRLKPIESLLLLICLFLNTQVLASVQLSAQQTGILHGVCEGSGQGFAVSRYQQKILVFGDEQAEIIENGLSAKTRAQSLNEAGLILCLDSYDTEIERCDYLLFDVPRIRQDIDARLVSVRSPDTTISSISIKGSTPPPCDDAGVITSATKSISGDAPDASSILAFIDESGGNLEDWDGDKISNLAEIIAGTDPRVVNPEAINSLITVNGNTNLAVQETEEVTLSLDFDPGESAKQKAEYSVWIETGDKVYTFSPRRGFEETQEPGISVRARAVKFKNFNLATFPTFGNGDYRLYFSVSIDGEVKTLSEAVLSISTNEWHFEEVSLTAGIVHEHGFLPEGDDLAEELTLLVSGVAAGDYDNDGWVDLYFTQGDIGNNLLYRNLGNGTFIEVAEEAGVAVAASTSLSDTSAQSSGATFADYDGDGWLDLMVNGINGTTQPILFLNNQDGTFTDVTEAANIPRIFQSMSSSFADYDKDGDMDFLITHWVSNAQQKRLFRQNDDNTFTDVSEEAGLESAIYNGFTGNFADINNDGWLDLLIAADFGTSQIFINNADGTFTNTTDETIDDDFGMGAAVGDYDNDGDLDWFVTSIHDKSLENPEVDGNRLYRNKGDGSFENITGLTRTRDGGWGWGTCFADFNNDGFLDLFQVNGYTGDHNREFGVFLFDRSNLFINIHDGSFTNQAELRGVDDTIQGRGLVCFDYDRDGDIDILVAGNRNRPRLYENRDLDAQNWLHVRIEGEAGNSEAIGARIYLTIGEQTQMRELRAGSNFLSQNPVIAYFGLGEAEVVDELRVVWPSGAERILTNVSVDQTLFVEQ